MVVKTVPKQINIGTKSIQSGIAWEHWPDSHE